MKWPRTRSSVSATDRASRGCDAEFAKGSRETHLVLVIIESLDTRLIPDIPQLDQAVRGGRDELHACREEVYAEDGVGVALECLLGSARAA